MGRLRARAMREDARLREHWRTRACERSDGPTWVVLGDSAAVGLGAGGSEDTYVSVAARTAEQALGRPLHVVNLAVSGATASTVLRDQVPALERLGDVDAVTCVVGGNDVAWPVRFDVAAFGAAVAAIASRLPPGATLGLVPSFGHWPYEGRVRRANAVIAAVARERSLGVADLYSVTAGVGWRVRLRRTAADMFHPSAEGHALWADAVLPGLLRQLRG